MVVVGGCRQFRASTAKFVSVDSWEFITLLLNKLPMATANADFDPFYLRYVAFYLLRWFIYRLLTDTSKNLRIYAESLLKHR